MTYDAVLACSVALLRGLELRSRSTRALPGVGCAYDQAAAFVRAVGPERALRAVGSALAAPAKRKGRNVRWI